MRNFTRRIGWPFALVALASLALSVRGPFAARPVECLALYLAAGIGWWWSLHRARAGGVSLRWVVAGAVLLRLVGLAADLRTSDDAARVVWEGRVVLDGSSPYAHPPDARELESLARAAPRLHAAVGHRDVPASYPPLVQGVGVLAAELTGERDDPDAGVRAVRALFAIADLLALVPLVALLRRRGLPDGLALAWGWCPLAVFEIAGAGHLEALALAPLLGALAVSERSRSRAGELGAAALFALAILAKLLPIVLLPWFARDARAPAGSPSALVRRALVRVALVLTFVALGFAPFLPPFSGLRGAERGVLAGLGEYALRWDGLNLAHRFVEGACALVFDRDLAWSDPRRLARGLLALVWLAWAWCTWRRERDPARAALDLFGAWLVVTPILHPWYALWCVPWLAFRRSSAFAFLTAAAPLAFAPVVAWQREGRWVEPAWLWPVLVVPFALLLARDRARAHAREPA